MVSALSALVVSALTIPLRVCSTPLALVISLSILPLSASSAPVALIVSALMAPVIPLSLTPSADTVK